MRGSKEAARRCGNIGRAKSGADADRDILARTYRIAAWVIGLAFGAMFALGIIAG